jgi:hypothetical protein
MSSPWSSSSSATAPSSSAWSGAGERASLWVSPAAAIVVLILALVVGVVVLRDLGAGALGIVRVLGLVAGALDVDHSRGGIRAGAAVRAGCDGDTDADGKHRGENEQKLVEGIH